MQALGINNPQILIRTHKEARHGGQYHSTFEFYLEFLRLQLVSEMMNLKIVYTTAYIQYCFLKRKKQTKNGILEIWTTLAHKFHIVGQSFSHSVLQFPIN